MPERVDPKSIDFPTTAIRWHGSGGAEPLLCLTPLWR